MRLYAILNVFFPRSYVAKVIFVAFLCIHVPLIAAVAYFVLRGGGLGANLDIAAVLLVASLLGTVVSVVALGALLVPMERVRAAMADFDAARLRKPLPAGYQDEIGAIMSMTNRLVLGLHAEAKSTRSDAEIDDLTGLLNRRGFRNATKDVGPGVVLYCDLDYFKQINTDLGRAVGDDTLRRTAQRLALAVRPEDLVARFGGEEFVIFLPGLDLVTGTAVADRLKFEISNWPAVEGHTLSASFAAAPTSGERHNLQSAIDAAAEALGDAKVNGPARVEWVIPEPA
jgi:diguanylate cyclase (GGDEF)-like protein